MLEVGKRYNGFLLKKKGDLYFANEEAYLFEHEKTGLEVLFVASEDSNKACNIVFNTPLEDGTGVRHILEHSVLCGSRKYKSKDPFNVLARTSLNTFLNAFTSMEKTYYIFSSANEVDFMNMMNVYLDCVFYPAVYEDKRIFENEGWHYELDDAGNLIYNGVVFNEMKPYVTDKGFHIYQSDMRHVFPHTGFKHVSGGDIFEIPKLSYEKFLKYHKEYYHPSNCKIILYGNLNILDALAVMNEEYLEGFKKRNIVIENRKQEAEIAEKIWTHFYPATEDEKIEDLHEITITYRLPDELSIQEAIMVDLLTDYLDFSESSELKVAICHSGLAKDITVWQDMTDYGKVVKITVSGVKKKDVDEVIDKVCITLRDIHTSGLKARRLNATVCKFEYQRMKKKRSRPYGIYLAQRISDGWINGTSPLDWNLARDMEEIRTWANEDVEVFEDLYKDIFLLDTSENLYIGIYKPDSNFDVRMKKKLAKRLALIKGQMTEEELDAIRRNTAILDEYRNKVDTKEELDTIPKLKKEDIPKTIEWRKPLSVLIDERPADLYKVPGANLDLVRLYFNVKDLSDEEVQYLKLVSTLLGELATKKYSSEALAEEMKTYIGDIHATMCFYNSHKEMLELGLEFSFLHSNLAKAFRVVNEILRNSKFEDLELVRNIVESEIEGLKEDIRYNPYELVNKKVIAGMSRAGHLVELTTSHSYLTFLREYKDALDRDSLGALKLLASVYQKVFTKARCTITAIGDFTKNSKKGEEFRLELERCIKSLRKGKKVELSSYQSDIRNVSTAYVSKSLVNYVGMSYNLSKLDLRNFGSVDVIESFVSDGYLWDEIRLKGGAYGAWAVNYISGHFALYSYRDPNFERTLETFRALPEFLKEYDGEDLEGYIIGTIARLENYNSTYGFLCKCDIQKRCGRKKAEKQRRHDKVLATDAKDIQDYGKYLSECAEEVIICVAANKDAVARNKELFEDILEI